MRIGLDGYPLSEIKTGVGHYTYELSRHLATLAEEYGDEYLLVSPRPFEQSAIAGIHTPETTNRLRLIEQRTNFLTSRWWGIGLPRFLRKEKLEIFHGTNHQIPLVGACPSVVTIHDLSLLLHPGWHERRAVRRGRLFLPRIAHRASLIITPTESVRREVVGHLGVAAENVVCVHEAPRECFYPATEKEATEARVRLGVEKDFVLCVATLEPRKNLARLLTAFVELLRATNAKPQLVLVGRKGWLVADLMRRIDDFGSRLRWLGYVADADLRALYSSCKLFVYPSLYEGFGLPPLEAMSCGAPVVASRIASIAEVTGNAARLVAPTDTDALAHALIDLWGDRAARDELSSRGLQRASEFTWKRTAELTRAIYVRAIGETQRG